jgi:hypothetical protein
LRIARAFRQPRVKGAHLGRGVGLVEAEHRFPVPDDREQSRAVVADPGGRHAPHRSFRKRVLQRSQLALEPVVGKVADLRRGFLKIERIVAGDLGAQRRDPPCGLAGTHPARDAWEIAPAWFPCHDHGGSHEQARDST